MPLDIDQNRDEYFANVDKDRYIFESREEMSKSLTRLCYGNLYIIGRIWIEGLKYTLTGSKMCLIPTVHAAPPPPPKKPPKMRVKDLPLYGNSPHVDYANFEEDESRKNCPALDKKILQQYVLPTVSKYRKGNQETLCEFKTFIQDMYKDVKVDLQKNKEDFKKWIRSDDNMIVRNIVFALGPITGYCFAKRKGFNDISRISFTILGGITTGWLCYPKETDEVVRATSYQAIKGVLAFYSFWIGCPYGLKPDPICKEDLPAVPPPRKEDPKYKCPPAPPRSSAAMNEQC